MRDALERTQGLGDRVVVDPGGAGGGGRRGRILAVVRAGNERLRRKLVVARELDALGAARNRPEAARHDRRVLGGLALEHPQLDVRVGFERSVAVEMVGLEVEEDADLRLERLDVLELKRGELADDPRIVADGADERGQRHPDVPGDLDGTARRTEHGTEELARGRLAVRPGHAEDGVREQPRTELDLAPDRDAARPGALHEHGLARYSRALHDEIDPL
jgi:hypothetical protein